MFLVCLLSLSVFGQSVSQLTTGRRNNVAAGAFTEHCNCMDYWDCVLKGGSPESYCDPFETSVCCFLPSNPQTVGLLPLAKARSAVCGRKGTDTGQQDRAELGEWPWHVAVIERESNLYVCGGSLIDERWVVTAAHCVSDYGRTEKVKVRLGEYDVLIPSKALPYEEFEISRIVIHPEFSNVSLINDIALLQLDQRAKKRPHIDIVCLPPGDQNKNIDTKAKCVVTGWGKTNESTSHSIVLKEISLPLWAHDDCQKTLREHFGSNYTLAPTVLCAGANDRDACDGDGGGPLVCESRGIWHQVGIVSFGLGCSRPGVPGIYTYVPAFTSWIKSVVRQYS